MDTETHKLKQEISDLKAQVQRLASQQNQSYYFSDEALHRWDSCSDIPEQGHSPATVKTIIENNHLMDFDQHLNTSSYVNVTFEKEEEDVALMGLRINLADQTVYPQSYKLHDTVVNMIAKMWHCPAPEDGAAYPGAGTVGSTEACLLSGLALKFRWRKWYQQRHPEEKNILGARPNIIISSCYQAAWEKLFKYIDIEPKLIKPSKNSFTIDPEKVREAIDENTIGVVCIMGNHYGGQYDPVWDVDKVVTETNKAKGFQVGIHVDAASGGFIAPFQDELQPWDFRLDNVLSISTSGHKYGESCCGTGWVVWRQREDLSEHVAISVTYLGGKADSYTLNFSRPASGVYVQYYKLLRYGMSGYRQCCSNMMQNAEYIRQGLKKIKKNGVPRFEFLDNGSKNCLPVVTARLNPELNESFDDIDLQHVLSQNHWYVSGYRMGFNDPIDESMTGLFYDAEPEKTMFRIVVKSNLTRDMANHLLNSFGEAFEFLDSVNFTNGQKTPLNNANKDENHLGSVHC